MPPMPGTENINTSGYSSNRTTDEVESICSELDKKMSVKKDLPIMERKGYGSTGRTIALLANYFDLEANDKKVIAIHRYECLISSPSPRRLDRDEKRHIFWALVKGDVEEKIFKSVHALAYDDADCLWTAEKINLGGSGHLETQFRTLLPGNNRPSDYTISLKYTSMVATDINELAKDFAESGTVAFQAIDIVLSQGPRCPLSEKSLGWYPYGRALYRVPTGHNLDRMRIDIGGGREVWTGLTMAAKIGQDWKPMINIDVARTVFVKRQPLIDFMCDVFQSVARKYKMTEDLFHRKNVVCTTQLNDNWMIRELNNSLKGMKLRTTHGASPRGYKFVAVSDPPVNIEFTDGDGNKTNVLEFFRNKYHLELKYPHLPSIQVSPRQKRNFIPMELLQIALEPQKVTKRLTDKQTADMIRASAKPARERRQMIEAYMAEAEYNTDPFLQTFSLSINTRMKQLKGRVLPEPLLDNGTNIGLRVNQGEWRVKTRFAVAAADIAYSLVSFVPKPQESMLQNFCQKLVDACESLGMRMNVSSGRWPINVEYGDPNNTDDIRAKLKAAAKTKSPQQPNVNLVLVVLPGGAKISHAYGVIKAWGDVDDGVMTQVVMANTVNKASDRGKATLDNLAMKINAKMGGINNGVHPKNDYWKKFTNNMEPTVFLGVDVTHPGAGDRNTPSIAAVVASADFHATKYAASIKVQHKKQEHVIYAIEAVKDLLMHFKKTTDCKPAHIVLYRDGVSESQFPTVLREELTNVREACRSLQDDYRPTITYIVVQKRHHTRFFCQRDEDGMGRAGNVPPGTTVDNVVTHPLMNDFFLCSHYGVQGTSRPAHYVCLHDDWELTADELQSMTYYLCHVYARCARTVSIPAPVYYAHLACFRARSHHLDKFGIGGSSDRTERDRDEESTVGSSETALNSAVTVNSNLQDTMYFI